MALKHAATETPTRVGLTPEELRARLTPEQYKVTCECGTEPSFSGAYWNTKDAGTYQCVVCGAALFDSDTKFDSATGWPSFWDPVAQEAITNLEDRGFLMTRTEVRCAKCDAHLGHVFPDGPDPTGLRYCINSASLKLERR